MFSGPVGDFLFFIAVPGVTSAPLKINYRCVKLMMSLMMSLSQAEDDKFEK